jgi:hypothetical protein
MEENFEKYISYVIKIRRFVNKSFAKENYSGIKYIPELPRRSFDLKNEFQITGYVFHGNGCDFRFKSLSIDIEFTYDVIGFTAWSFFTYLRDEAKFTSTENEVTNFLEKLVKSGRLNRTENIYF